MKGLFAGMFAVTLFARSVILGQCADPYDGVLCMTKLTAEQAGQFATNDQAISAFWASLSGDFVTMVPPGNCAAGACGFTDGSDGSMIIKAAGTEVGLYLYVEVQDNVWVDPVAGSYGDDSVDLYFDKLDASSIATCSDCLVGLYSSALTYSTKQFQVFMGATTAPVAFRLAYYDESLWSWQTNERLEFSSAKTLFGIGIEVVTIEGTKKAQEWFLPWSYLGIVDGTNLSNTKIGLAGGYNDIDGDNTSPDKLRWPADGDPWADASVKSYWGDILIPENMTVSVGVRDKNPQVRNATRAYEAAGKTHLYSLRGERISERQFSRADGVVIRHDGTGAALTSVRVTR